MVMAMLVRRGTLNLYTSCVQEFKDMSANRQEQQKFKKNFHKSKIFVILQQKLS